MPRSATSPPRLGVQGRAGGDGAPVGNGAGNAAPRTAPVTCTGTKPRANDARILRSQAAATAAGVDATPSRPPGASAGFCAGAMRAHRNAATN